MRRPTYSIESIGPKEAAVMLENNPHNRHLRPSWVAVLARRMKAGKWKETAEPIKFDGPGILLDGQHRLQAIITSGMTLEFIVVRGLNPDARFAMDTGAKRTGTDALVMDGFGGDARAVGAACNYLWRFLRYGGVNTDRAPDNEDIIQTFTEHPEIQESVEATKAARTKAIWGSHGLFAFCHYIFSRQDRDAADQFMAGLLSGIGLESSRDPIWILRDRLIHEATRQAKITTSYIAQLTFKAWAIWREGEERSQLRLRKRGEGIEKFPDIGPIPGISDKAELTW